MSGARFRGLWGAVLNTDGGGGGACCCSVVSPLKTLNIHVAAYSYNVKATFGL